MDLAPEQLRSIASSYRLSQVVYALASLGIPDALRGGALTAREVAGRVDADPPRMGRLLRAAASEGIIRADGECYALNGFSRQLCSDGDESMRDVLVGWLALRPGYVAFAYLDEVVRGRASGMEQAFGERFHDYMRSHPVDARLYAQANAETVDAFRQAAAAYDFGRFERVVDVGGGHGSFLLAIAERYPHVRGVLFDFPDVVAGAQARLAPFPAAARISVVGGDMFDDVPEGGDAYLFSTVLRCFEDDECVTVLRRCAERMTAGGHVLAVEMLMPDGTPESPSGLADLQAMVVYGGKDRTRGEWADLLLEAGYHPPEFHPAGEPYSLIAAVPR